MNAEIKRWGNSAAIRLPAQLIRALGLSVDSLVDMHLKDNCIVIEPIQTPEYGLESLLEASTADQFALEDDDREWLDAPPIGREDPL
ncbi:AbrB/MazE/SpoVT family DNA-binding domain-containing protein [Candidatus Thiosymbion oneisti]|uniref:AbrB/MazE/SpoVT family DNA-binding domain-containing protein n=1 Tax=Candidatus Thiosymbion oneisti TaxID=589554 RepID=UPI000B7F066A|nr:AbrB/MazE/SpoVT family DNA-binding domain-containing protein [Candidatus Thiosymbion oneisti]